MPLPVHSTRFSATTASWFEARFGQPTAIQSSAWSALASRSNVLISAPTGAGKSLAAWLPLIDRIRQQRRSDSSAVRLLYISPLRALSRDMAAGMFEWMQGLADWHSPAKSSEVELSLGLRTGDTPPAERARQRRQPPDILLTTPESLFVLLGSQGGRELLETVESVLIDEIHALIDNKRGAHLALSLERLERLTSSPLQRIGLSATARPLEQVADFLVGAGRDCRIVDWGEPRPPEIHVELPAHPLGHFAGQLHWEFIAGRLLELAGMPGTMLVFCNTRGLVERVAGLLAELLGEDQVAGHHGSLGSARREEVELGLKQGRLKVVVCTASLELGIDIGPLDRVCQLGSCLSINTFRQRAGRARHRPDQIGRIHAFPLSLSDLLDIQAMQAAMIEGTIDPVRSCQQPGDVLAQHIVAMVASGLTGIEEMLAIVQHASPWIDLSRNDFEAVVDMLHQGFVPGRETGRGPVLRSRPGHLEAAERIEKLCLVNAGTIPEWFEYDVISDQNKVIGRLDEEFAFESSPGQVLSLGGQAWRIIRIGPGHVDVESSDEPPANLPFWFGDGRGRSTALSESVQRIVSKRSSADSRLDDYLTISQRILGRLPGADCLVIERFFDPGGDQHLVIHTLRGARLNRAWGLALRKRFCRTFNFELQAAATDNGLLISLGAVHSFDLSEVISWLKHSSIAGVLTQALLDTPLFQTRLRWCASTALAIMRRDFRGKVPAQIQRNQTENLIARIFPDQLACLENLAGERRIPDHPLVQQALRDCLEDHMDLPGLLLLYEAIESGQVAVHAVDTDEPSPLAQALINAPQNSFLDPAAAEERRTRTFETPRARPRTVSVPLTQTDLASRTGLERALIRYGYLTAAEGERGGGAAGFMALIRQCAAVSFQPDSRRRFWVPIEHVAMMRKVWPKGLIRPFLSKNQVESSADDAEQSLCQLMLGRVRFLGEVREDQLMDETGLALPSIQAALNQLQAEGLLEARKQDSQVRWRERRRPENAAGSARTAGGTRSMIR